MAQVACRCVVHAALPGDAERSAMLPALPATSLSRKEQVTARRGDRPCASRCKPACTVMLCTLRTWEGS